MGAEPSDTFRILVATDNHLGYAEKHHERGNDSFQSFEEVLELAVEHNVDFILLGGDLFHENKPSRHCQVRCMDLLRKYTFGDRPVQFNFLSDPAVNFPHTQQVNYLDPNLNVSIPVFSIHGNHDDPAGLGHLCALEMLSSAGLINYFGRVTNLSEIKVSPILLEKGRTKLALYGISSVKDERLYRLFVENKVKMLRPKESLNEWFNIITVHQNHAKRGINNYLPETFLDPFLDLVIWGHEHDCILEPRQSAHNFHILQPGSSVATSLCSGEALPKNVFLVEVNHQHQFRATAVPLRTVRPFIFDELILSEHDVEEEIKGIKVNSKDEEDAFARLKLKSGLKSNKVKINPVEVFLEHHINQLLQEAKKLLTGHPRQPTLPLIRVRVVYNQESQLFNTCRFGYRFEGKVANTEDVVHFVKEKAEKKEGDHKVSYNDEDIISIDDVNSCVEDLVEDIFKNKSIPGCELELLTERGMGSALNAFVLKDDNHAITSLIEHQVKRTQEYVMGLDKDYESTAELEEDIRKYRLERLAERNVGSEEAETLAALGSAVKSQKSGNNQSEDGEMDENSDIDDDDDDDFSSPSVKGRGSRGGRGSRRGRGTTLTTRGNASTRPSRGRGSRGRRRTLI